MTKLADLDVKRDPILLNDGCHIGVRVLLGPQAEMEDDYMTEADLVAGEEFRILSEQKRKEAEEEAKIKGIYRQNDSAAVRINLEDDEEEK